MSVKLYWPQLEEGEHSPPPRARDVFEALLDDARYWTRDDWLKFKAQIDRHIMDMNRGKC